MPTPCPGLRCQPATPIVNVCQRDPGPHGLDPLLVALSDASVRNELQFTPRGHAPRGGGPPRQIPGSSPRFRSQVQVPG